VPHFDEVLKAPQTAAERLDAGLAIALAAEEAAGIPALWAMVSSQPCRRPEPALPPQTRHR
jgi:hypothetical protein